MQQSWSRLFATLALALTLVFAWSATASAQPRNAVELRDIPIGALAIRIDDSENEFNVIDSQMDETATAAVFFGMIGAAVNSGINNSEDDAKAAPLRPTAAAIDLDGLVLTAIRERLAARNTIQLADTPEAATHTLVVEIHDWGLVRRAQRPDTAMRTFLKMNIRILDANGRLLWGPQVDHSIGQLNADLAAFTPDVFQTEMEALATRAGQGIANRMIYR